MLSLRHLSIAILVLSGLAASAACSASKASSDGKLCTPGAYVYCRCEDRSEGTKLCHDDGAAFDACVCDGSGGTPTDDGTGDPVDVDGGLEGVDSGTPAGPAIDAACVGKLGLVAGASDDTYTYVFSYAGGGQFDVAKGHPGIRSNASVIAVGGSLVATYAGDYQAILWTKMTGSTWSAPFSVGSAQTTSGIAAAAFNGGVRMFYLGTDKAYHMGTYGSGGWDDATALAQPSAGLGGIPGLSAPAAASISTSVILTFDGNDGTLARETYSSSSWSVVGKFTGASAYESQPSMVALDAGGKDDLLLVYTGDDLVLHAVARDSASHTWGTPSIVDSAATTATSPSETTLVSMPGGKAMLIYRGTNNAAYWTIWDPTAGTWWSPKDLLSGSPALAAVPAATRGACGSDVSVAYARAAGGVEILRFKDGAWTGPFTVGGLGKATYVGIGEMN